MLDLDEVQTYSVAALFTTALNCTIIDQGTSSTGSYWGLDNEQLFCEFILGNVTVEEFDEELQTMFYGMWVVCPGGILQSFYAQLGLPASCWPGLMKIPEVYGGQPRSDVGKKKLRDYLNTLVQVIDKKLSLSWQEPASDNNAYKKSRRSFQYRRSSCDHGSGVIMANSKSLKDLVQEDYIQVAYEPTEPIKEQQQAHQKLVDQEDCNKSNSQLKNNNTENNGGAKDNGLLHPLDDDWQYSGTLPEPVRFSLSGDKSIEEYTLDELQEEVREQQQQEQGDVEKIKLRYRIIEGSILPEGGFGPRIAYEHVAAPQSLAALYVLLNAVVKTAEEKIRERYSPSAADQKVQEQPASAMESEYEKFEKHSEQEKMVLNDSLGSDLDVLGNVSEMEQSSESGEAVSEGVEWNLVKDESWFGYDSRARSAIKLVAHWLNVPYKTLLAYEAGLAATNNDQAANDQVSVDNVTSRARWIKVGLAAVGGGTLLAVTGGLAAPAIAAGLGGAITILGGSAATATVISGFVGSTGGIALTTTAFGAAGAARGGHIAAKATKSVQELGFWDLDVPIDDEEEFNSTSKSPSSSDIGRKRRTWKEWWGQRQRSNKINKILPFPCNLYRTKDSLSVTIAISGWISNKCDFIDTWQALPRNGQECYAVIWETKLLKKLGRAIWDFLASTASSEAAKWFFQTFLFTSLMVALALPLAANTLMGFMDNVWRVTQARAQKAGMLLARMLMQGAHGWKPVTLIGYSQGARVIFYCLLELERHDAFGIIESVVMLGAPVGIHAEKWNMARSVVSGRFVNGYCVSDWILGLVYRSQNGFIRDAAGLVPVDVAGIQNVDLSQIVNGHTDYQTKIPEILDTVNIFNR